MFRGSSDARGGTMTQEFTARPRAIIGDDGRARTHLSSNGHGRVDETDPLGLMTPAEVAAILHVDANTVARWSDGGKLRAMRTPGGHRRYYASEVLRLARRGNG